MLLSLQDLGKGSVAQLREKLGKSEGEMKSAGRVWTPYEDERIRVLASSGTSAAEIAAQITDKEKRVSGPQTSSPVEDRSGHADDKGKIIHPGPREHRPRRAVVSVAPSLRIAS
jgi:hypothetical protein